MSGLTGFDTASSRTIGTHNKFLYMAGHKRSRWPRKSRQQCEGSEAGREKQQKEKADHNDLSRRVTTMMVARLQFVL